MVDIAAPERPWNGEVLVIAGSGRSGTTWLLETMTRHPRTMAVFEPLHPRQVPEAAKLASRLLARGDDAPEVREHVAQVFFGRLRPSWRPWMRMGISKEARPIRRAVQRVYNAYDVLRPPPVRRVVKFINANLMLSWLSSTFQVRIVLLLREPELVVASQRNMGWNADLNRYLQQERLLEHLRSDEVRVARSATSLVERLAVAWCLENKFALQEARKNPTSIRVESFPRLRSERERVFDLMRDLGYSLSEVNFSRSYLTLREKLRSSYRRSRQGEGLSEAEVDTVRRVTEVFEMDDWRNAWEASV